ncbi:hypothetical protein OS493_035616 [Desmophyllum pertusum]|uniref:WSC domain-containing protein n=1 Tax=Desmophyllum pertusum TaxID=174260 RepID=A0A9W9ZK05_9CNID|nr:hypothetical protein OS493_035616 [Desmophyllum pertusum]
MAYSYFGETEIKEIPDAHPPYSAPYSIAKFEFQTPILINGSAEVKVSGLHSLFVSSKEGIYIGVNIDVGKAQLAVDKNVGGFCVSAEKANEGNGPGRGWNDTNAGAGHGGKGGLLFENNERIYGATYGTDSDISLIGGSTGTTKEDTDSVIACGGGAIKIYTEKNLTINAKIRANGKTLSVLQKSSSGGSSGGTIILESKKHVILGDNSRLEAQGADAVKATNDMESSRGGGGGGVIGIFHKEGLVGNKPTPTENTKGGNGTRKGDNGLVVINGTRTYGYPAVVIEENYVGCVNVIPSFSSPQKYSLKAHEAAPSKCIEECLKHKFHFAFIQNKDCWCSNANLTMVHAHKGNETRCNARCWSNSSLICGGDSGLSAYKTGYISSSAATILSSATTVVSAVFPSKASVVAVPSSSVSQITPAPTEPTKHTKPTEVAVPSSSVSPITPVPTKPTEVAVPSSSVSPITPVPTEPTEVAVPSSSVSPITPVPTEPTEVPKPTDEPTTRSPTEPSEKSILEVASSLLSEVNVDSWGVPTQNENNTERLYAKRNLQEDELLLIFLIKDHA